jgi:two-component system C4-dicarboxylate transport sensor histidine kinase DctB
MIEKLTKGHIGVFIVLSAITALWAHQGIIESHTKDLQAKASERVGLYQSSLNNELKRFGFLPHIVARNLELIDSAFSNPDQANISLEGIKNASGADVIYVMSKFGETLASSNWRSPTSFVGNNFAFRPYFKEAVSAGKGHFFGIGTTSKKPGYYISSGVSEGDEITAVTVAKVDLSIIENTWLEAGENIFVTNRDGVIILSSKEEWKYSALFPLNTKQLLSISEQRQFADEQLNLLTDAYQANDSEIMIDGIPYLENVTDVGEQWKMHFLTPESSVAQLAVVTWAKIGSIILGAVAVFLLIWLSQFHDKLQVSRKESFELKKLNSLLKKEIENRQKIEGELIVAQKDIKRTSKLAAMGQLSASIIHELGQPLSAMKTYIASSQLPNKQNQIDIDHVQSILPKLEGLVDRMAEISQQLKFFTRSGENELSLIDIRHALNQALTITQFDLEEENVEIEVLCEDVTYLVMAGQIRMEQVFINLINNARVAMTHCKTKKITFRIDTKEEEGQIIVKVKDAGEGMSKDTLHALFDPFYTTKPTGVSLGLGLTISTNIIHEFHGSLTAMNNTGKGACFIITLPMA